MTTTQKKKKSYPVLEDIHGAKYQPMDELARGGQGVVYTTEHPGVLVKGFTSKDDKVKQKWRDHMEWLIRQDIADLKLARPLTLLKAPRMGYVMELMDGLIPLKDIFDRFINASDEVSEENPAPHIQNYLDEGGLRRRIRILAQLARTLNQLHCRGMLYGDLSPDNVFVSADSAYAETWLIDCDNISFESHCDFTVHTPDYGAPEVVREEAMLSSLTDCWSFAVIAYQLLTHNHPLKGDVVNEGEPEVEDEALRGEHPWINDPDNFDNECFTNLPMQLIENSALPALFQKTFGLGKNTPSERPSMAQWLEALTEVDEHLFVCHECNGQTMLSLDNVDLENASCFFCDSAIDEKLVLFEEFIKLSEHEKQDKYPELSGNTIVTGRKVCLQTGDQKELKRLMPSFSYDKVATDHIQLEYTDTMLIITPVEPLSISRGEGKIQAFKKKISLKITARGRNDEPYCIHLGDPQLTHVFWQFRW
ncbi:protein kinase domain-containing protein [Idiomarina abyssalis]|uniref:protein kinase domain-containing protein n=1 Tax=Idiomarina abyssalis TaxID=86102 RepID=UPI003A9462B8